MRCMPVLAVEGIFNVKFLVVVKEQQDVVAVGPAISSLDEKSPSSLKSIHIEAD